MLFRRKTCEQCGNKYDITQKECPYCHQIDGNYRNLGLPKNICWLSIWQQIALFFAGFVFGGYLIYQLIFAYLFKSLIVDQTQYYFAVLCCMYLAIFLTAFFICFPRARETLEHFKKWDNYLYGIGYAFTILAFSSLCGILTQYVFGGTTNNNQSAVETYLNFSPVIALFIMGIIGPICEELTYRVGLYSFLRRLNKYVAFIVTMIVFALIHFSFDPSQFQNEIVNLPSYLVAGFLFCLAYEHKGPACSMTAHICYNLISLILTLIQK